MKFTKQSETEYFGRFEENEELVTALEKFCAGQKIECAWFSIIGAVKSSKFAFYDQPQKKYLVMELEEEGEILNCTGNIAQREGKAVVHAHITLADREGSAYGGHLMAAKLFAAEFYLKKFEKTVERKLDKATNLALLEP